MKAAALALALLPAIAQAQAVRIIDGDSIVMGKERLRLAGIDAPELRQRCPDGWPAGAIAKQALEDLVQMGPLDCASLGQDIYGRTLAHCRAGNVNINRTMVASGYAWAYVHYSVAYLADERTAVDKGVQAHHCQPAWIWRREHRK